MTHTAPLNVPYAQEDIDSSDDCISVAIACDKTIEFMIVDHVNKGNKKFSSMSADDAIAFAEAIIKAAKQLKEETKQ